MTKYAENDVERLIAAARWMVSKNPQLVMGKGLVEIALEAFPEPDPDEQVIEKMAIAWHNVMDPYTEAEPGTVSLKAMRAALAAYRQHIERSDLEEQG